MLVPLTAKRNHGRSYAGPDECIQETWEKLRRLMRVGTMGVRLYVIGMNDRVV